METDREIRPTPVEHAGLGGAGAAAGPLAAPRLTERVLALQHGAGNAAVARLVADAADARAALAFRTLARDNGATKAPPAPAQAPPAADDVHSQVIRETTDTGNEYKQELRINKTKHQIRIRLGVKWTKRGTWDTDEAFRSFVGKVSAAAHRYLDGKFKVVVTPAKGASVDFPIAIVLDDDASGYEIECFGKLHGRGAMSESGGKLYELGQTGEATMPDVYAAHEFGHALLGVSDEYANPAVPGRTITDDHSIMGDFYAQGVDKAEFKARHFQHLVEPVSKQFPGAKSKLAAM